VRVTLSARAIACLIVSPTPRIKGLLAWRGMASEQECRVRPEGAREQRGCVSGLSQMLCLVTAEEHQGDELRAGDKQTAQRNTWSEDGVHPPMTPRDHEAVTDHESKVCSGRKAVK
jgi:hypothetical protein